MGSSDKAVVVAVVVQEIVGVEGKEQGEHEQSSDVEAYDLRKAPLNTYFPFPHHFVPIPPC